MDRSKSPEINIQNEEEEKCFICYENLDDTATVLKCGHKFHYNCIFLTYKSNIKQNYQFNGRECPYCRRDGGYLNLKVGYLPTKNINSEFSDWDNDLKNNNYKCWEKYLNKDKCYYFLKTGKNAGKQCSRSKSGGIDFCKMHGKKLQICPKVVD